MTMSTATQQYRVVSTTTTGFVDPKVDTSIVWEGSDIDELSREYPPSNIMFADPFDQKEIENGFIITRFTFERQLEDGSWEEIDDPRRRLTPVTAYERAIDAENRRDFPGDYITEDDEDDFSFDNREVWGDVEDDEPEYNCYNCADNGCEVCMTLCVDCRVEPVDTEGDVCMSCQAYYAQLDEEYNNSCIMCRNAPQQVGEVCKVCNQDIIEMERMYHQYVGFLWKFYYWLRNKTVKMARKVKAIITSS
jgi:hypothetical protein